MNSEAGGAVRRWIGRFCLGASMALLLAGCTSKNDSPVLEQPAPEARTGWIEVTPGTYPQPDNPGTLNEADTSRFFEALGQALQPDEFSVVRVGIEAGLARFSAFCPDRPAHLIDRPAGMSNWQSSLVLKTMMRSRAVDYWQLSCGKAFPMKLFLIEWKDGTYRYATGHPGFTSADLTLQLDTRIALVAAVAMKTKAVCKEAPWVYFTSILAYAPNGSGNDFLEEWQAVACGKIYSVPVTFNSSPMGGVDFTFWREMSAARSSLSKKP